jgi:Protein of unknown function (DUF3154).
MGIFGDVTGLGAAATAVEKITDKILSFFPNAEQKAEVAKQINDLTLAIVNNQSATNTAEANTGSLFLAGWRPFVGWVLAIGFTYSLAWPIVHGQPIDKETINTMLWGMLGLGTWRTADKIGGVATAAIKKVLGR